MGEGIWTQATMNRAILRWALGSCVRVVFGRRTLTLTGEAGVPFQFCPAENPRLLIGGRRVDPELRSQWCRLLKKGETILDVGAHIGFTVERFYSILNGQCDVWAFEPNPRNFKILDANVRALGSSRINLINSAVGEYDGKAAFYDNRRHGAISRFTATRGAGRYNGSLYWKDSEEITVDSIRLDTFLERHSDVHPTFVKIDVEGAAEMVLRGAAKLLERHRPGIHCEFHGADERAGACRILGAAGYRGIAFASDGQMSWTSPQEAFGYFMHPTDPKVANLNLG